MQYPQGMETAAEIKIEGPGMQDRSIKEHSKSFERTLRRTAAIVTLGGFLFGFDAGVINGAFLSMNFGGAPLAEWQKGIVASSLVLGAAFGSFISGRLADALGRKKVIFYLAIILGLGSMLSACAPSIAIIVIARIVLGLAIGGCSVVVPMFLSEISPVNRRGGMVTQNDLMIVFGQLCAYVSNAILAEAFAEHADTWRYMLILGTAPAIILWIGTFFISESPRWYALIGHADQADEALHKIRNPQEVQQELSDIQQNLASEQYAQEHGGRWRLSDVWRLPWARKLLLIGVGLAATQQLTGINSIMYYGSEILVGSGFEDQGAIKANIANGVISVIAVLIAIRVLRSARRQRMLLVGLVGTTLSLILLAVSSSLPGGALRAVTTLTMSVIFLAFHQACVSPITWLLISEIFPQKIRGAAMGFSVFCLWIVNFLVVLLFPMSVEFLGISATFAIFAVIGIGLIYFVKTKVPETLNRSLENLENDFRTENF